MYLWKATAWWCPSAYDAQDNIHSRPATTCCTGRFNIINYSGACAACFCPAFSPALLRFKPRVTNTCRHLPQPHHLQLPLHSLLCHPQHQPQVLLLTDSASDLVPFALCSLSVPHSSCQLVAGACRTHIRASFMQLFHASSRALACNFADLG